MSEKSYPVCAVCHDTGYILVSSGGGAEHSLIPVYGLRVSKEPCISSACLRRRATEVAQKIKGGTCADD